MILPRTLAILTFLLLGASSLSSAAAYTPLTDEDGDEIEPNPYIVGNLTIDVHKSECGDDVLCFHDDSDKISSLTDYGISLNAGMIGEPIRFYPQKVDCQFYGEDTTSEATKAKTSGWCSNISTTMSWLDPAKWVVTSGEGNDTFERIKRNGADSLHFISPGTNPGTIDSDTYTLDFPDITADVDKMRLIVGVEFVTKGAGVNQHSFAVRVYDGNGTGNSQFLYSDAPTATALNSYVVMNGTGVTFHDPLVVNSYTGGTVNGGVSGDIGKLVLEVRSDSGVAASEVYLWALALQVKRIEFGTDDSGSPVYNMTYSGCDGKAKTVPEGYMCLAEFGPNFDYTAAGGMRLSYLVEASALPETNVDVIATENDDDDYPWRTDYEFAFDLPEMVDLTYAGDDELRYELRVDGRQHESVTIGGKDKSNLVTGQDVGDSVKLATAIGSEATELEMVVLYTEAQRHEVTEVGFLGLPSSHPLSKIWIWLSGFALIGLVFARGLRRSRRRG